MADIVSVPDPAMLRLTVDLGRRPELAPRIEAALGLPLPHAGEPSGTDPVLIWQGPGDLLIVGGDALLAKARRALEAIAAEAPMLLGDGAAGLAAFDLGGAAIAPRIAEWMHGSRAPRSSAVRKLAGLRVTLLAEARPEPRIRAFVDRSYADYFRQWLDVTLR